MKDRKNSFGKNQPAPHEAVAVVGLGLSLPGAETPDDFWSNILNGRRFFQPATSLDWGADPNLFYQPDGLAVDKAYSLNGAFNQNRTLTADDWPSLEGFDLKSADGSLTFWLNAGRRACLDARLSEVPPEQIGVIAGHVILPTTAMAEAAVSLYTREAVKGWDTKPSLDVPPANAFKMMGYSARLLAQAMGFKGPAYTLDAACASSLYAVSLAMEELLSGRLSAVVTGGVAKADALFAQIGFSQLRALSHSGEINAFDQTADGLVVGEGAVALILKRLDTALAHGDHIRAIIRGVGLSNDRTGNLLAPQAEGQMRAMKNAWAQTGLDPAETQLIEAHGTGTILGDQVEVETLKELLASGSALPKEAPVLGSIKSGLGHLLSAAGAASLAKVILALENKTLPPTAGFKNEAKGLNLAASPALRVLTKPEVWPEPKPGRARLAVVNAFGFGGVNAQAIIEEWNPDLWPKNPPGVKINNLNGELKARLLSARALSAPWPDFSSMAQNWMDSEGPPLISTRRYGSLKAKGLFFNNLALEGYSLRLAPKDLSHILPQQALALKLTIEALSEAGLDAETNKNLITAIGSGPTAPGIDKTRVGVFMGVDIDPRSADYAFRWLGPIRAAEALVAAGELPQRDAEAFVSDLRQKCGPPLSASRVIGALGSLVASRVARFIGSGGPAFTVTEENLSGLRAMELGLRAIDRGEIDLALVGTVDVMGDPKTGAMEPDKLWEEGAAMLVLASPKAAEILKRSSAPELLKPALLEGRIGGLGGLYPLIKSAFYLRHHVISRGLGVGTAYWIKNQDVPRRSLDGPGFSLTETNPEKTSPSPYSYDESTWFPIKADSPDQAIALLSNLEEMVKETIKQNTIEGLGPIRAEKRALKRLGDVFWALYGKKIKASPALALMARGFEELSGMIRKAKGQLLGDQQGLTADQKGRIHWALNQKPIKGDLAWVFPGSGSHYHGLGRRLAMSFPDIFDELYEKSPLTGHHFQTAAFWAPAHKEINPIQAMAGQVSFGLLAAKVLRRFNIVPKAILGHSLGETTALVATEAWADRDALYHDLMTLPLFTKNLGGEFRILKQYWNWPANKPLRWVTGVLQCSTETVTRAIEALPLSQRDHVFLLLTNARNESVVGGDEPAVKSLAYSLNMGLCPVEGVAAVHNPSVNLVADEYRKFHTRPTTAPENITFYSSYLGKSYQLDSEATAESLTAQAIHGHDFQKLIEQAYADGVRFFIEAGPGNSASRLIGNILNGRPHVAVSLSPGPHEEGWGGLNRMFIELWLAGYPIDLSAMYPEADQVVMTLPIPITLAPQAKLWPMPGEIKKRISSAEQELRLSEKQPEAHQADILPQPEQASSKVAIKYKKKQPEAHQADILPQPEQASSKVAIKYKKKQPEAHQADILPQPEQASSKVATKDKKKKPEPKLASTPPSAVEQNDPSPRTRNADKVQNDFDAWLSETKQLREKRAAAEKVDGPAPLTREQCLEFAVGKIADVLGPRFAEVDTYPSRVRLPDEPLMLVDRVLSVEGQALSMNKGRIVTEHDILPNAWYLDNGHIPTGLAIESGQADLLLSAWLGADFTTKGLSLYRLLDAEVIFYRELPKAGETARYDIRITRFFKYGETRLFRFEFDAHINNQPLLSMKGGCAGFFSPAELSGGRGLPGGGLIDEMPPPSINPQAIFSATRPAFLKYEELEALRRGDLETALGSEFKLNLKKPLTIPGGRMGLIDRVTKISDQGGRYGSGFIRAEFDIDPKAWFLVCHFVDDEVMPGTLMYESCLYTLRTYLIALGWLGEADEVDWQPVPGLSANLKCRGQVTESTKMVAYEVHIRELDFRAVTPGGEPEPVALADAVMLADNRPAVEVRNMNLRLKGSSLAKLKALWNAAKTVAPETIKAGKPAGHTFKTAAPEIIKAVKPAGGTFDKKSLLEFAEGRVSNTLGPDYAKFDDGSFVARLPRPPYDFIDKAEISNCPPGQIVPGATVTADYTVKKNSWLLTEAGGTAPHLPYAALNEAALQPCGFLAAFMGSALPFDGPMHFRNLGGRAQVLGPVFGGDSLITKASLTKSSRMGEMVIQHYDFNCSVNGRTVYEGLTHFGFFSEAALAQQAGLTGENLQAWPDLSKALVEYPKGPLWPQGRWRMIDKVAVQPHGGPEGLGLAYAQTDVDPSAWFFAAHFYQDPVWPGSLGLEAFLQTAKVLAKEKLAANFQEEEISWLSPRPQTTHEWLYRGQITPDKGRMTVYAAVTNLDPQADYLTADGLIAIDGLPIYKLSGFSLGLKTRKPPLSMVSPTPDGGQVSAEQLLNWRKEHGVSQGQLARMIGVTPIYVSLLERGKRNISALMNEKLSLVIAGGPEAADEASEILAKGTLKARREEKAEAYKLLTPDHLKNLRISRGFSQKKLADQVGVTATLIGLIELDKRSLSLDLAKKILAVFEEG